MYHFFIKVIGILLMLVEIGWFIALPVLKEASIWWSMRKLLTLPGLLRSGLILLAILAVLLFPWRGSIRIPAVLEAENVSVLYAPSAARCAHCMSTTVSR